MPDKPTYKELEKRVLELEQSLAGRTPDRRSIQEPQGGTAIHDNAEQYRLMVENANEAILVAQDGVFVFSNPKGEALFGCSKKELGSRPLAEFIHEADRRMVAERHEGRLAGDTSIPDVYPFRIIHESGDIRWVNLKVALFFSKNRPACLCFMTDITEQKLAEDALRRTEARYKSIFLNKHVVMLVIDPDTGAIRDANPAAVTYYGWPYEKLTNLNIEQINTLPSEKTQTEMRSARTKHRNFFHFQHRLRDGTVRDVEVFSGPVEYGGKSLLFSIVHDIGDLKQTENVLKEREAFLDTLFNAIPIPVFYKNRAGQYMGFNDAYESFFGKSKERLTGKTVFDISPQNLAEIYHAKDNELFESGGIQVYESQVKTANGDLRDVIFNKSIYRDSKGEVAGLIGGILDVTERKKADAALKNALAEKEILLREIHHRVKNNMQVIISLLRMYSRKNRDQHLKTVFDDCRGRIEAMSLIHEALYQSDDLSRIDFESYLKKLCRNLAQAHDARGKRITLTAKASDVTLNMDQGVAVGMIIAELISNAFKHAFPSGRSGNVTVGMTQLDAETVELTVIDDGKGLPPDFDMSSPGSLGMRLVAGAVTRELGGSIDAESDNGARFIIRFGHRPTRF